MLSIIIPSRERVGLLKGLLESIEGLRRGEVEVLVGYDGDDKETKEFILGSKVKSVEYIRKDNINEYYNELAFISSGEYIWALNDDCEVMTEGYDGLISNEMGKAFKGDGIGYGMVDDGSLPYDYGWFPILTREAYECMGMFFHYQYKSWASDKWLGSMFGGGREEDKDTCKGKAHMLSHEDAGEGRSKPEGRGAA